MGNQNYSFRIEDNSGAVRRAMETAEDRILEALGIQAQSHTIANITQAGRVDTGLMRNSIAYAVSGQQPSLGAYGNSGKQQRTYKADKPDKDGVVRKGAYTGHAPKSEGGHKAVYIGSNVEYFAYQELGFRLPSGAHVAGMHALKNACEQVKGEAEQIARTILANAPEG